MSLREILCLLPLLVMIFWIGLQPSFFLDRMAPTLNELIEPAMKAVEERGAKEELRGGKGEESGNAPRLRSRGEARRFSPRDRSRGAFCSAVLPTVAIPFIIHPSSVDPSDP